MGERVTLLPHQEWWSRWSRETDRVEPAPTEHQGPLAGHTGSCDRVTRAIIGKTDVRCSCGAEE